MPSSAPDQSTAGAKPLRLLSFMPFGVWIVVAGLLGGIVGLGGFTFTYAEGFSYFSDDPQACINCHVMREVFEGWNHSSHKAVAVCNDCHIPHTFPAKYIMRGLNGWNHRRASMRWDFISSENSTGFHSPQEAARVLADAIDYARQAQLSAERVTAKRSR